ncbi:unnamed protein product [Pylaiella littoralis]
MAHGPRGSCGRTLHGRPAPGGSSNAPLLCFACDRPGAREEDHCNQRWHHVGDGTYWSGLGDWAAEVGEGWSFVLGECLCSRTDCVFNLYGQFRKRAAKAEIGSLDIMSVGQSSPMGRYPTTKAQVVALLAHVTLEGEVLDSCGAAGDAVSTVLTAHALCVSTNDLNHLLNADTHMDAASDGFVRLFRQEGRQPD